MLKIASIPALWQPRLSGPLAIEQGVRFDGFSDLANDDTSSAPPFEERFA
jgi:hypothetical protein